MHDINYAQSQKDMPYSYMHDDLTKTIELNQPKQIEPGIYFTLEKLTFSEGQTNNTVTIEYTLENTTGRDVGINTPNLVMYVDEQVLELIDPIEGHLRIIPTGTSTHLKNYTVPKEVTQIGYISNNGEKFVIELTN